MVTSPHELGSRHAPASLQTSAPASGRQSFDLDAMVDSHALLATATILPVAVTAAAAVEDDDMASTAGPLPSAPSNDTASVRPSAHSATVTDMDSTPPAPAAKPVFAIRLLGLETSSNVRPSSPLARLPKLSVYSTTVSSTTRQSFDLDALPVTTETADTQPDDGNLSAGGLVINMPPPSSLTKEAVALHTIVSASQAQLRLGPVIDNTPPIPEPSIAPSVIIVEPEDQDEPQELHSISPLRANVHRSVSDAIQPTFFVKPAVKSPVEMLRLSSLNVESLNNSDAGSVVASTVGSDLGPFAATYKNVRDSKDLNQERIQEQSGAQRDSTSDVVSKMPIIPEMRESMDSASTNARASMPEPAHERRGNISILPEDLHPLESIPEASDSFVMNLTLEAVSAAVEKVSKQAEADCAISPLRQTTSILRKSESKKRGNSVRFKTAKAETTTDELAPNAPRWFWKYGEGKREDQYFMPYSSDYSQQIEQRYQEYLVCHCL